MSLYQGARDLIRLATVAALLVVGARADEAGGPSSKPNILFILADDQRADTIAALGNTQIRTPNLDRLAREGTAFTRAYCMGSMQGAVCVPSRAMMLTGRSLFHIKDDLAGQDTWPEAFAKAGYSTFLTGKWHNGSKSALRIFQAGRAIFLGGMGDPYKQTIQDIGPQHTFVDKRQSGEHAIQRFADAAIDFLKDQSAEKPFLCYAAFNAPHDPRVAPPSYHEWYNAHRPPLPANYLPEHPFNNGALTIRDEKLAPWPRTPEVVREHLADYYASIEHIDAQVGRILDALKASGQYDRTIIVFASDHGLAIGSHGLFGKQNLYDHSMRLPLLIAGPGIPKGRRSHAFCYLLDIYPTLGELAGVTGPDGSEGLSLVPVLDGRRSSERESIFTAYGNSQRAVRDDRWKLIVYPQINKSQLFDLKADPQETRDLSADPAFTAEVRRLTALLTDWQGQIDDQQPLTSPDPLPPEFDFSKVPEQAKAKAKVQ